MRLALGILIVASFVLAIRHDFLGKRAVLVSARFDDGLILQLRPPDPQAQVAVACRGEEHDFALHGAWFPPGRVRGPYAEAGDDVALGSYALEDEDVTECQVDVVGSIDPLSFCIHRDGGTTDEPCDPPMRPLGGSEPQSIEHALGP